MESVHDVVKVNRFHDTRAQVNHPHQPRMPVDCEHRSSEVGQFLPTFVGRRHRHGLRNTGKSDRMLAVVTYDGLVKMNHQILFVLQRESGKQPDGRTAHIYFADETRGVHHIVRLVFINKVQKVIGAHSANRLVYTRHDALAQFHMTAGAFV